MNKIFEVRSQSIPGRPDRPNEDRAGWDGKRSAWVIDGGTGLGDRVSYLGLQKETDASWLAQRLHDLFIVHSKDHGADLLGLLNDCRLRLKDEFESGMKFKPEGAYAWPCAAVLILHFGEDGITLASLGDCSAFLSFSGGEIETAGVDARLVQMDKKNIALMEQYRDSSGNTGGVRGKILPFLREGRNMGNVSGGYSLFTLDKEILADLAFLKTYTAGDVSEILLATDGVSALVDDYEYMNASDMVDMAQKQGFQEVFRILRQIEDADPDSVKYPRFKKSDDASLLSIRPA